MPILKRLILYCVALTAVLTHLAAADRPADRPNILLILIDDLGWADLGCYGADLHDTPHLDALAKSGVRFTQAYSSAPICSPTRAAIMTGKHPARLNMTIWREGSFNRPKDKKLIPPFSEPDLPHTEHSLAKVLHEAGYLTAHLGKWHLGDADHAPETQGFDVHLGGTHWGAPATHFYPYRGAFNKEARYVPHLEWGKSGEYLTDRLTDEAIKVIERAGERPFFLNLWHYTVHAPLEAPQALVDAYEQKRRPEFHHQNATYAAMIKSLDDNIGRLMQTLEDRKIADRTVVIFTSDNGGLDSKQRPNFATSNHPLRSGKGTLYEGGIRVPMIVRWPGVTPKETECAAPVVSADLYPTLLEMANVPAKTPRNEISDGISLAEVLKTPSAKLAREELFWHYPHYYHHTATTPASAIRSGDWKLIETYEDGKVELYDLAEDLSESQDLAGSRPEIAGRLKARLASWREDVSAQLPTVNEEYRAAKP